MAICAITINSVRLLLRSKAPIWLLLLLVVAVPVSSYYIFTGDGTLTGVLRMMITFNHYVVGVIMLLLTLYLSATVLNSELSEEQITLTAAKPVARWKILLGKWLAVAIITGFLTGASATTGYYAVIKRTDLAQVINIRKESPDTLNYTPANFIEDAKNEIQIANYEVLTAMTPHRPILPPMEDELEKIYTELQASGQPKDKLPTKAQIRMILNRQRSKKSFTIPFNAGREFVFTNLPQTDGGLKVRYTLNGSRRPEELGWLTANWYFYPDRTKAPYGHVTNSRSGTTKSFNIPGSIIGADGNLNVAIYNVNGPTNTSPAAVLEIPMYTGINIMVPDSGFAMNCFKGALLSWLRLLMVAAIGVGASAFLSGSVTSFLLFSIIMIGMLNSFIYDTVAPKASLYKVEDDSNVVSKFAAQTILQALPDFTTTSAVPPLTTATAISWRYLLMIFTYDVLLRGGIIFIIGVFALNKREIGIPRIYR